MIDHPVSLQTSVECIRQYTMTEKFQNRKKMLEEELVEINKCLQALEKNPEMQNVFDQLSKFAGRLY